MQITVTFNRFEEMREFAKMILRDDAEMAGLAAEPHITVETSVAAQTTAAPVTPTAPVQPAAAPMTQTQPAAAPAAAQSPVSAPTAAPTAPVQTSTVTYTPDDLARAAMALMDSGKQQELIGLLGQFGVAAIPELRPEQYGAFATALRGMGAQI